MRNREQNHLGMIFLLVVFSILTFLAIPESHAQNVIGVQGLNRVGPVDPDTGYPMWYEDKNGLKLQLCLDLDNCFIEPPNPLLPLHMPTTPDDPAANFPDESFFFAAESIFPGVNKGDRAVLVMALEGIFFGDAGVVINDQAVMSRIRIRIDGLISGEDYTVIYPYGMETFTVGGDAGPGAAKGPGISMTRDIGLVEPLFFEGPLKGDIGPFLVPYGYTPGPAASFISDGGLTEEFVTGSPLGTNVFRIEGPGVGSTYNDFSIVLAGGQLHPNECASLMPLGPLKETGLPLKREDCAEYNKFSLMGQIASKFGAKIDRSTYTLENGGTYVNVWASTVSGQKLVASIDGGPAMNLTEGLVGNYFGRFKLDLPSGQIPKEVTLSNISDIPASSESKPITDQLTIKEATYIVGEGLHVAVQSSNLINISDIDATLTVGQATPVVIKLDDKGGGLATGINYVGVGFTEEHPSVKVTVTSSYGGKAEANVTVLGGPTGNQAGGGVLMTGVLANAGPDQNVVADGRTVILNGSKSLGPLALTYTWAHDDTTGAVVLTDPTNGLAGANSAQTSFSTPTLATPLPGGKLTVNFTLTVSDGINSDTDVITVNMVQPAELPVDHCSVATDANPLGLVHPPGGPRYRENREKWIVEGSCYLADNQVISVWLGNPTTPKLALVGQTRVDALGNWEVAPGNRSAGGDGTIPKFDLNENPLNPTTQLFIESSRGSAFTAQFTIN